MIGSEAALALLRFFFSAVIGVLVTRGVPTGTRSSILSLPGLPRRAGLRLCRPSGWCRVERAGSCGSLLPSPVERRRDSLSHGHQNQLHNFTVQPHPLAPWANTNFAFSGWARRVSAPPSCNTNPGAEQLRRALPNLKCWHVTDSRDSTGTSQTMFRLRNAWLLAEVVWLSLAVAMRRRRFQFRLRG